MTFCERSPPSSPRPPPAPLKPSLSPFRRKPLWGFKDGFQLGFKGRGGERGERGLQRRASGWALGGEGSDGKRR